MKSIGPQDAGRAGLAILLAALAVSTAAAESAAAERFRDWSRDCPAGAGAPCTLETPARNAELEPGTRLRLLAPKGGAVQEIVLEAESPVLTRRFPLLLRVDSEPPIRLGLGQGIEAGTDGTLRITGQAQLDRLLGQMGPGRRIRLEFYDSAERSRFAIFSLMGLSAALGERSGATRAKAAPAPQRKPEPQPKPEPKRKQTTELRPPPVLSDGGLRTAGQGLPANSVFTPRGKIPPPGDCYEHRRSIDETGRFLGWISTNLC